MERSERNKKWNMRMGIFSADVRAETFGVSQFWRKRYRFCWFILQTICTKHAINSTIITTGVVAAFSHLMICYISNSEGPQAFLSLPLISCLNWFILHNVIDGKVSKNRDSMNLKIVTSRPPNGHNYLCTWNLNNLIKIMIVVF